VPKYFYKCSHCNEEQSFLHGFSETKTDCVFCGSENTLKKIIKRFNVEKPNKPSQVGSLVKSSIEEFKQELEEEKRSMQEEMYE
jgi:hypothetical protein